MSATNEPSRQAGKPDLRTHLQWLGICLVGVAVLALIATQVPERGRLIGLFAVVFGMLSGWGMGYVANECSLRRSIFSVAATGVIIATALVGITFQQYREYCVQLEKIYKAAPEIEYQPVGQPVSSGMFSVPSKTRSAEKSPVKTSTEPRIRPAPPMSQSLVGKLQAARLEQLEEKTRFASYLQHRLKQAAELSANWAIVIWIGETLIGAVAGAWMMYRVVPGPVT